MNYERNNSVGAPLGNQNARKLTTSELRQQAYQAYCQHLSKGKSPRSFTFEHPEFSVTGQTIQKMIRDPIEFPSIHKEIAEAKGFGFWEQMIEDSALGKNKQANTASLQIIMRNKFGWDREDNRDKEVDPAYLESLKELFDSMSVCQSRQLKSLS